MHEHNTIAYSAYVRTAFNTLTGEALISEITQFIVKMADKSDELRTDMRQAQEDRDRLQSRLDSM